MSTPGEEIRKRLRDRGWTQAELAQVLHRPIQTVNQIIQGKKAITPDMAAELAAAFGAEPEMWMQLESQFRLSLTRIDPGPIQRRARLYDYAPVKEMIRRGWIQRTESLEHQERDICEFFGVDSLNETPNIHAATRRANRAIPLSPAQAAWCSRVKQIGRALQAPPLDSSGFNRTAKRLRELAAYPEEVGHVSRILGEVGIRFVVVEPLTNMRMDGATIWLDDQSPVIAVSVQHERMDNFWFTVFHEFSHVVHGDASIDDNLCGEGRTPSLVKEDEERNADNEAAATLIPPDKLQSFIVRVGPLYSKTRIIQFAHTMQIHPGIVVGQLQDRGEIGWYANREMLVKIRGFVAESSVTDGWGRTIGVSL